MSGDKGKVWIDLDNSPHVPFFKPIIQELENRGYSLLITARDCFQVCGLADMHRIPYRRIGHHYGKNKIIKLTGLFLRAMQLAPTVWREKPTVALSHGSRSQLILSNLLRIPSIVIFDYEHVKGLFMTQPSGAIVPEVIPDSAVRSRTANVRRYPGIKEDAYVPNFTPKPGILGELGVNEEEVVVTVRPPATEAHYHAHMSDVLFDAVVARVTQTPNVRMILLPRNEHQESQIKGRWPELFAARKIVVPPKVVDGLNLIWFSDLVISGGGTMNREAAALGVPVYSIFRGKTGVVDEYLEQAGRLKLLKSEEDVRQRLALVKWNRPVEPDGKARPALLHIVEAIEAFIAEQIAATVKTVEEAGVQQSTGNRDGL